MPRSRKSKGGMSSQNGSNTKQLRELLLQKLSLLGPARTVRKPAPSRSSKSTAMVLYDEKKSV